jgi:LemA protein
MTSTTLLLGLCALLLLWAVGAYTRLVRLRNDIAHAFGLVDEQLNRRLERLLELAEQSRRHLPHERDSIERVLAARAQLKAAADLVRVRPLDASRIQSLDMAEATLASALQRLDLALQQSPSCATDDALQAALDATRQANQKAAYAQQFFNDVAQKHNEAVDSPPASLIAALFGFSPSAVLQSQVHSPQPDRAPARPPP